ncbi:MAG: hypothetical protein EA376_11340 [Phycisphaeraceae bacterium]|nr:MAG: hypothetical protein EA376_11340 [Phycisphaeraceae bacterium]
MTIEQLRQIHANRPFLPFVLHLADGGKLPVRHPEVMAISPNNRIAVVFDDKGASHFVDVMLVSDVEVLPQNGSNGRKRKK